MDDTTDLHLLTARLNQQFATQVADSPLGAPSGGELNWAAVAAFYAAVHYVNACLWEVARIEPRNHGDRQKHIATWPMLSLFLPEYLALFDYGFRVRYVAGFQIRHDDLHALVAQNLSVVRQTVERRLGADVP